MNILLAYCQKLIRRWKASPKARPEQMELPFRTRRR